MNVRSSQSASWLLLAAHAADVGWDRLALPSLFGILRSVMMVLGGLVVIAIILIVAVAIVSGVMGMIGKLRR